MLMKKIYIHSCITLFCFYWKEKDPRCSHWIFIRLCAWNFLSGLIILKMICVDIFNCQKNDKNMVRREIL